ncbi:MAG: ABC transporter ATP-binding protein [Candidatus Cloacimonadales bacterium]|nr:ABC transporter ATP-binding protein [Candidatus Cloacimonadales bacterium]
MSLKIVDLSFGYDELLFSNLDLELETNKITLLQGDNGSGKTTFCRLLSGLEKNYSGQILLDNIKISELKAKQIAEKLIYLKQEPIGNTVAATPEEDLSIWQGILEKNLSMKQQNERMQALEKMQIKELIHSPFWEMSGGQVKRAGLAAMLLYPQKYWILDEPFSGLHPEIVNILLEILLERKNNGFGALIISHKQNIFDSLFDITFRIEDRRILKNED